MKTTKQEIIQVTYSFYSNYSTSNFSLSSIAEKLGITKPALYKHFKDKQALLDALEDNFFENIENEKTKIESTFENAESNFDKIGKLIKGFAVYFIKNPNYCKYFCFSFTGDKSFKEKFLEKFYPKGLKEKITTDNILKIQFSLTSFLYFIIIFSTKFPNADEKEILEFTESLKNLIFYGWSSLSDIDENRKKELRTISKIEKEELPSQSKAHQAFTNCVAKYGLQNTTVDKIAKEMGLSKSSMYTYMKSKNDFIKQLVMDEFSTFMKLKSERDEKCNSTSEFIYESLFYNANYLTLRDTMRHIHKWARINSFKIFPEIFKLANEIEKNNFDLIINNFNFEISKRGVLRWINFIPISILISFKNNEISESELNNSIDKLYLIIKNGITYR